MPYIEQPQIATQKPIEQCPRCQTEMDAEFIDNGFGPYAVQASPWRCPECGYNEYQGGSDTSPALRRRVDWAKVPERMSPNEYGLGLPGDEW